MIAPADHALFRARIDGAQTFVLTTHMNPDGDALGSEIGLARFLLSRGKQVRIINQDPTPPALSFIEQPELSVEIYDPSAHDGVLQQADRVVLLDNSAPDRLGRMEPAMLGVAARTLCIDHHPVREMPWADQVLDEAACATAAMVYELTRACGFQPDAATAEALYAGLATDTGFFRYNSANAAAHTVAAELLQLGVRPARTYEAIYERNSVAFTRLLGHALAGLEVQLNGALVLVRLTLRQVVELQAESVDTSEFTTPLLAMERVQLALLFRELADGRVKVSLRSKGAADVHRLAAEFGGGGHRNASGIVMVGSLDDVVDRVTARARALLAG